MSYVRHHISMKLTSFLLFCIVSLIGFGQGTYKGIFGDSIKKLEWTCHIAYLPSPQSEFISLKATPSSLVVKYSSYKIRKLYRRKVTRRVKVSKKDFSEIHELYTSLNQPYVNFPLTENDKDSLRAFLNDTLYDGSQLYKLDKQLLDKYLTRDTIEMDMSVFAKDSFNNMLLGVVIDGAPFRFNMMRISSSNDTITQNYKGNLYGGTRYRDLPKYLAYAILYNETHLFGRLPFRTYFSRSNILRVILRYLEGKEGLIEFAPFELLLDEN